MNKWWFSSKSQRFHTLSQNSICICTHKSCPTHEKVLISKVLYIYGGTKHVFTQIHPTYPYGWSTYLEVFRGQIKVLILWWSPSTIAGIELRSTRISNSEIPAAGTVIRKENVQARGNIVTDCMRFNLVQRRPQGLLVYVLFIVCSLLGQFVWLVQEGNY